MTIKNLSWELETKFTRKQVVSMALVAGFVGNIESHLKDKFPSGTKDIDWTTVREVMRLFASLGAQDTMAYRGLCQSVQDMNDGKMQFSNGKVVLKEKETK